MPAAKRSRARAGEPSSCDDPPARAPGDGPEAAGDDPAADGGTLTAYAANPVGFVETVLGQRPWSKQAEILRAVAAARQTTVRSSHGVGKTWVAACSALWWVYCHRPSLVLTTAPTARQVEGVLWAEIHRLWHGARRGGKGETGRRGDGATGGRGDRAVTVRERKQGERAGASEGEAEADLYPALLPDGRGSVGPAPCLALAPSPHLVLPGRCLQTRLAASTEQMALGLSTNEPEKFAGWHCEHLLVIVDEASGVPDRLFEVIQGTLTAAHCHLLLIGNPTRTSGFFFESHRRAGWEKLRISAYDTPNFATDEVMMGRVPAQRVDDEGNRSGHPLTSSPAPLITSSALPCPWLVTPEWVAQRRQEWGEESDAFRVRVLGEFPRASADTLIELAWVEAAEQRRSGVQAFGRSGEDGTAQEGLNDEDQCLAAVSPERLNARTPERLNAVVFGLDVARFGDCETVLAVRRGEALIALERWCGADLMQTCGRVVAAARREQPERIVVDAVGLGAGVVDRLRELQREGELGGVEIVPFASGERASDPARWRSRRDEAYWGLRERYRDGEIRHAACWSGLTGQLTALRYRFTSRGQVEIESKDELRRRGLPSPDQADAVALAFAPLAAPVFVPVALAAQRPVAWPLPPLR